MKYCGRCLQPDTRPNTRFSDAGVCPACDYVEAVQGCRLGRSDWDILADLFDSRKRARKRKPGVSSTIASSASAGGKDSTRQALWVRDRFGINPLARLPELPARASDRSWHAQPVELDRTRIRCRRSAAPAPATWRSLEARRLLEIHEQHFAATELALFSAVPQIALALRHRPDPVGREPGRCNSVT